MTKRLFSKIIKRDGRKVKFESEKIIQAIEKAGQATGEFGREVAEKLAAKVLLLAKEVLKDKKTPTVEEIQDIVELVLFNSPFWKTARAYAIYREQHRQLREIVSQADVSLVDKYLEKITWEIRENSNMTFSLQGLNNYVSSKIISTYWLNKIYPEEIRKAHEEGDFHLHDLSNLSVYCVGWDLYDLLLKGFGGVPGKIESKPAKHFHSALGQLVNFLYSLQGETAGAVAVSNFDTLLAPFIYYDKLSYREVSQALQEFLFNMNVPTRVGFQTPFSNITLDLTPPPQLANSPVLIGGKLQDKTYKEFQKEIDIFNKALLENFLEGDGKGRVFSFPIPTYNITKDFDWDNKNLDLLWRVTAKYGLPYFANFINSDMKPEDIKSMCCRLRIDTRKLKKRGGGLFGSNPLTGSVGVTTINMPRLGYLSKSKKEFKERLERLMVLARNSLEIKRKTLEKLTDKGLYPYSRYYLSGIKKRFNQWWKNHFSTIGLVGMNEACLNLFGEDIASEKSRKFALEILDFMRKKLIEFQKETGNNYNLEATPAEGVSYRLPQIDLKKYPDIITAGTREKPFYTNSTQLPVNYTDDIFEAIELQDKFQCMYTGGTVLHLFVGEKISQPEIVKKLVRKIFEKFNLPYLTITPTFSICPNCGYLPGEQYVCPKCKANCEVYSRVVGYLRPVNQWNDGKQEEFKERKTFKIKE